jgi:hypothetical protein
MVIILNFKLKLEKKTEQSSYPDPRLWQEPHLVEQMRSILYQCLDLIDSLEINKPQLDGLRRSVHLNPVANVDALKPAFQHPFNRHIEKPNPIAFHGCTRNHGFKLLSNSRFKEKRSS